MAQAMGEARAMSDSEISEELRALVEAQDSADPQDVGELIDVSRLGNEEAVR